MPFPTDDEALAATRHWLEAAVIGLDLCPFAQAVHSRGLIRQAVSDAATPEALLTDLVRELHLLVDTDPAEIETTLLIHPAALEDFLEYNDFLDVAEAALEELGLDGTIQIAGFHPDYRFAGTSPDDVTNCTNRSPYPMLHLLRESSVDRAVEAFPETHKIYEKNIETLRRLGMEGWRRRMGGDPAENG
ncbi:MAG TPA: DUF1415 domain-containing protein [Acidobacteria bacterium]|nr:DUF1415 domain-containing protein [Acidobacteriota bacterium]